MAGDNNTCEWTAAAAPDLVWTRLDLTWQADRVIVDPMTLDPSMIPVHICCSLGGVVMKRDPYSEFVMAALWK